jgi:predicted house-cleaning noncanonical NTP pyrophosphatase (MazG superfamily)
VQLTNDLLHYLRTHKVLLAQASPENLLRGAINDTISDLLMESERNDRDGGTPVSRIVPALVEAMQRPEHFGEIQPGFFNAKGDQLVIDPKFDWWDLWNFGSTDKGGLAQFLRVCDLPASTQDAELFVAVGLLLINDAIAAIESNNPFLAAHSLHRADWCVQESRLHKLQSLPTKNVKEAIREILSARGREAGLKSAATRSAAALSSAKIQREAKELIDEGKDPRGVTSILANRHGVSNEHIRKLRKKPI